MAMQTLTAPILWPGFCRSIASAPTFANTVTIQSGTYFAFVTMAREDMTITGVGVRNGVVTSSGTGEIRIETVDATTGLATGTLFNGGAQNVAMGVLTTNTFALYTLGASATILKGEVFAVRINYTSGTSFQVFGYSQAAMNTVLPYRADSGSTSVLSAQPAVALASGATTFYCVPGLLPGSAITNNTFSNSVAGTKRGLKFTPPFKCRVVGLRLWGNGATGGFTARIEDDGGSEVSSTGTLIDGNQYHSGTNGMTEIYFDAAATLTAGTAYRAVIEPDSATNCNITTATLHTADYRAAWPHGLNSVYCTYTTGGGAWDDTATTLLPFMDIIIDQLDDGAGAGGGGQRVYGG
jgi:hypothetical protein